jgi:hypothetical protein
MYGSLMFFFFALNIIFSCFVGRSSLNRRFFCRSNARLGAKIAVNGLTRWMIRRGGCHGNCLASGKRYGKLWKIMENHHFLMGKSTISMAIFNSFCMFTRG